MATMELSTVNYICKRCGTAFSRSKGYFPICYGALYKGTGTLPYCRDCVDELYDEYAKEASPMDAARQVCRKLDLYWNQGLYAVVEKTRGTKSVMTAYLQRASQVKYAGLSYDDTLREEHSLWVWPRSYNSVDVQEPVPDEEGIVDIPEDVIAFWGPGYKSKMYLDLEQRRKYWASKYPEGTTLSVGEEAIIRQICILEISINQDMAEGKSVDKSVNALNSLLGSMNLKPAQKKTDADTNLDGVPFGVGIAWCEKYRPIPKPDPELEDVDGVVRYIEVWLKGHLSKMLGLKNAYSRMYEEEISKYTVEKPEYKDEDEETAFYDIFSQKEEDTE